VLISDLIARLREWGATDVEEAVVVQEDVRFALPSQVMK